MKKQSSDAYAFHLKMWQVTDPYSTAVEDAKVAPVQDEQPIEFRALEALAKFFHKKPQIPAANCTQKLA